METNGFRLQLFFPVELKLGFPKKISLSLYGLVSEEEEEMSWNVDTERRAVTQSRRKSRQRVVSVLFIEGNGTGTGERRGSGSGVLVVGPRSLRNRGVCALQFPHHVTTDERFGGGQVVSSHRPTERSSAFVLALLSWDLGPTNRHGCHFLFFLLLIHFSSCSFAHVACLC